MNGLTHPGGKEITKKAFDLCRLPESSKVLDIGCNDGSTAAYLTSKYNLRVTGIDKSADAILNAKEKYPEIEFIEGDGQSLNFPSLSFDCVLMECTLSLMQHPVEAIHEAFCVLKEGGYLIMHDLYLQNPALEDFELLEEIRKPRAEDGENCGQERRFICTVNGVLIMNDIDAALDDLEFNIMLFEDRKPDLDSFAASKIFEGGNIEEYSIDKKGKTKISYFLLVARKVKK